MCSNICLKWLNFTGTRLSYRAYSQWKPRLHPFNDINSWKNAEKFTETLLKNVLFNEDGLVMINKPYGVGSHDPSKESSKHPIINHTLRTAVPNGQDFYLSSALDRLSEALGYSQLSIVKAPERFTSGVTILSAREDIPSKVRRSINKAKGQKQLHNSYLTLVLGSPKPLALLQKVGLKMEANPLGEGKKAVIVSSWSKAAIARSEVLPVKVEHKTLQESKLASLVEIRPSLTKWHFLRVYMAHLLSPILGDNLFASRVQHVLGVPVSVNPFSDATEQPQKFSRALLAALALRPGEEAIVPTHLHLYQVILPDFNGKGKDLEVIAPLPEYFLWTCNQLRLQEPQRLSLSSS